MSGYQSIKFEVLLKRLNIQPVNTKRLFEDQVLRLSGNLNLAVSFKARETIIKCVALDD
jgi:hypothetical protein